MKDWERATEYLLNNPGRVIRWSATIMGSFVGFLMGLWFMNQENVPATGRRRFNCLNQEAVVSQRIYNGLRAKFEAENMRILPSDSPVVMEMSEVCIE